MKLTRYALLLVMAAGLGFVTCNPGSSLAKWTIIAYYDGNCDLDLSKNGNSWVIAEAQEIERVGSTDQVQVIGMVGSLKTGGQCKYYRLEKHENELPDQLSSTVLEDLGTKDMSDKATLTNFIRFVIEEYPADHYMLMLKDHGGGWRGACIDEQNGAGNMMTMPTIRAALDTFHFDIIAFDACLMSMVEVAYELKDKADYLVASQFVTYAGTYGGEEWMTYLTGNPDASALDLAKKIVEACMNANERHQHTGHMAVTDLSQLDVLASKISTLGNDMVTHTGEHADEVFNAFGQTHRTELDDPCFCDLREFCLKLKQEPNLKTIPKIVEDCDNVVSAINAAVPMTRTNAVGVSRGGLCIYFPYHDTLFDSTDYVQCRFQSTTWQNFLSKFIAALSGGGTDKGSAYIQSTPGGATVWWDGTNTGSTTPLLVYNTPAGNHQVKLTLSGYNDWDSTVTVRAGETTQVHATLQQGGGGSATVTGTVTWIGGGLPSAYTLVYIDTLSGTQAYPIAQTQVDPATGNYSASVSLTSSLQVLAEAWDDVNNNQTYDIGVDGWGFYDPDGNQEWTTNDQFTISPGQTVPNINITLHLATDSRNPRRLVW